MLDQLIGNYKILSKIGEGGMGAVYKALDLMLEREVAIKALLPELARDPSVVERFRAEAITLAKLSHPNIAMLFSFLRQSDDYYMVMEYVRGESLDAVLRRERALPCERAVRLFCEALEGVGRAHRLGIIHRDLKLSNLMLTDEDSIKVLDFGIARVLGAARMTREGQFIGTLEYMSPEQIHGREADARSDIYSLGILLYAMLTGRVPFRSQSDYELMRIQVESPPPPPRAIAPHIPGEVENAILRALAKHPDERFQSVGEFRTALLAGVATPPPAYGFAHEPRAHVDAPAPPPPDMPDAQEDSVGEETIVRADRHGQAQRDEPVEDQPPEARAAIVPAGRIVGAQGAGANAEEIFVVTAEARAKPTQDDASPAEKMPNAEEALPAEEVVAAQESLALAGSTEGVGEDVSSAVSPTAVAAGEVAGADDVEFSPRYVRASGKSAVGTAAEESSVVRAPRPHAGKPGWTTYAGVAGASLLVAATMFALFGTGGESQPPIPSPSATPQTQATTPPTPVNKGTPLPQKRETPKPEARKPEPTATVKTVAQPSPTITKRREPVVAPVPVPEERRLAAAIQQHKETSHRKEMRNSNSARKQRRDDSGQEAINKALAPLRRGIRPQ
jgi:hypothetical protein